VLLGADLRGSGHSSPSGQREARQQPASPDFPLVNPVQRTFGGDADAFVVKVHPAGNTLLYSTYLGGGKQEQGSGIAVDAAGNAYVIGHTLTPFFPRMNTLQVERHGCETVSDLQFNTFAVKLDPAGATLLYTVCLGHSVGQEIAVDAAGNASLLGYTRSRTFPLVNPVQATFGGGEFDVFVATLNAAGSALLFSTYLGGSHSETGEGIAVDPAGNLYIGGRTNSPDFPTTQASPELARSRSSVDENAFVAKIVVAGR